MTGRRGMVVDGSGQSNALSNTLRPPRAHARKSVRRLCPGVLGSTAAYSIAGVPLGLDDLLVAEAGSAELVVEDPRDREHRVANHLGFQSSRCLAPEQAVTRVALVRGWFEPRSLAVGGRADDQPVHRFETKAPRDHLAGEPIE